MPSRRCESDSPAGHPFRVAIYTRQSRNSDGTLSSCDVQFELCREFVSARRNLGWSWCETRYDDDGESGENLDRLSLCRLLRDMRAGAIDGIVVHRLDRLTRKVKDLAELLSEFRDRGIQLSVVTDPSLGSSAMNTLVLNLLGSFAEFEREMIRERLADTRSALKRRGLRVAGRVPYGYKSDPLTKQLVRITGEANRVRKIFDWAGEGKTLTEIAIFANRRGWRTKPSNRFPKGGRWTPRQVAELLANPVYLGLIRVKDGSAPGQHRAIVDKEKFERAARRCSRSPCFDDSTKA